MSDQIKTKVSKQQYSSKQDNSVKNCYFRRKQFHSQYPLSKTVKEV